MTDRPILFSSPMVRAILAGEKTQTRRVLKMTAAGCLAAQGKLPVSYHRADGTMQHAFADDSGHHAWIGKNYAEVGDRLWVRETWRSETNGGANGDDSVEVRYAADGVVRRFEHRDVGAAWVEPRACLRGVNAPGIHMPRWASRITLEVTGVRVERLQGIAEQDAVAEGVRAVHEPTSNVQNGYTIPARDKFADLWSSINGAESWEANPWVWVVEFRRVTQ